MIATAIRIQANTAEVHLSKAVMVKHFALCVSVGMQMLSFKLFFLISVLHYFLDQFTIDFQKVVYEKFVNEPLKCV